MASFEIFLMVCGVIGILTVLLNLFSSLGDHPKKRWASYVPSVDSDDFLVAIAEIVNAPLERGDEVAILNNGAEFLPAFLDALRSAKKTITFTAYMWRAGKMSDQVLAVLAERAAAGVEVRVLLDGLGGMFITPEELRPLTDAGGVVAWFRPPRFGKLTRLHRRNHRRAIVIDGRIGFTGGMAIADHWLGDAKNPKEWRDVMFKVTGTMAHNLQGAFAQL